MERESQIGVLLAAVSSPRDEIAFFAGLEAAPPSALCRWAANYHYFSTQQAPLLGHLVAALDPSDAETLSEVSKAIFEEFGSGAPPLAHSKLFLRFCNAAGLDTTRLPLKPQQVEPAVLDYVQFLADAYRSLEPGYALGAYCFLERSAVLSYPVMLRALRNLGFDEEALIFFSTHVIQEVAHDAGANRIAERLIVGDDMYRAFSDAIRLGTAHWSAMWHRFEEIRASSLERP